MEQDIYELQALIYRAIDQLLSKANVINDKFAVDLCLGNRNRPASQRANYGFRIKLSNYSFLMIWEKVSFYGGRNNRTRIVHAVTKRNLDRYPMASFKHAQSWEYDLIDNIEKSAAPIRKTLRNLGRMHRNLLEVAKCQGIELQPISCTERNPKRPRRY